MVHAGCRAIQPVIGITVSEEAGAYKQPRQDMAAENPLANTVY